MTDLDFDELDKAVNNLMGSKAPSQESSASPSETTASTPLSTSSPTVNQTSPPTRDLASPAPRPPATRRMGRFMDVIHPSSTMKPSLDSSARPPKEQEAPTESKPASDESKDVAAGLQTDSASASNTSTSSVATPSSSDWPDPVDLAAPSPVNAPTSSVTVPADTAPQNTPKEPDTSYSPFLSDAKVEKRPLGAPAPLSTGNDTTTPEDESAQLPAETKEIEPALPDELHKDLLAIESGTAQHPEGDLEEVEANKDKTPKVEPVKPEETSVKPELKPEYTGPTSIPQQYKEEPTTPKAESGAIYDTDTYHQPLAHPAKKKSGWLVVVWILLILILGAGAGAAFYLFWR